MPERRTGPPWADSLVRPKVGVKSVEGVKAEGIWEEGRVLHE